MDFVECLPKSNGTNLVLVMVNHFKKYVHFLGLKHLFLAKEVANKFTKEVVRLYEISLSQTGVVCF